MDAARILVVDDDPASQRLTRDILSTEGYELVFMPTGSAAMEEATRKAPDVILLDILMPGMDGFEVCRHLRLDPILAEVPIILVTALADRNSRLRGLDAGADDFVSKPVDVIELKTRVRNVVHLNRYRKLLKERTRAQRAEGESVSSCEATLTGLVRILERGDPTVDGRCDRVTALTLSLATMLQMPHADLSTLRWSALLQAIGAMSTPKPLPDRNPTRSKQEERDLKHDTWIIEALSPVTVLRDALEVLSSLYEHWDGSGRPRGLKGEGIPLAARVLAVALEWESAPAHEPPATSTRLAALKEQAGKRFDPRLVEMVERLVDGRHEPEAMLPGIALLASTPAAATGPQRSLLQRLSMSSAGARAQFTIAVALISVIPSLVTICLCMSGWLHFQIPFEELWPVTVVGLPFMALGYWMLAKYPINITRLRRYLESLTQGVMPDHVALVTDEDDLESIEMLMRKVIAQTEVRLHTIEAQTDALLDAERQRVMIQSLGAACHHLGQPATVLSSYLQLLQRTELSPDGQAMIAECRVAADSVASILDRLQRLTVYRTEPYLERSSGATAGRAADDILRM